MRRRLLAIAVLFTMGASSHAQLIYRCTDAAGKVQLSDKACGKDAVDGSRVLLRPNTLDTSGARELELRDENARLRQQMQQQRQNGATSSYGRTEADLQAERSNSYECRQAQRNLEAAASSITARNGQARRAAEQRMRAACGMREPTQVNVYHAPAPVRRPIPSTRGGFFNPSGDGYMSPQNEFCTRAPGGMNCPSGFVATH